MCIWPDQTTCRGDVITAVARQYVGAVVLPALRGESWTPRCWILSETLDSHLPFVPGASEPQSAVPTEMGCTVQHIGTARENTGIWLQYLIFFFFFKQFPRLKAMKFSKPRPRLACYTASSGCGICFSRHQLFVFSKSTESYTFGQQSKPKRKLLYEGKHRETKRND